MCCELKFVCLPSSSNPSSLSNVQRYLVVVQFGDITNRFQLIYRHHHPSSAFSLPTRLEFWANWEAKNQHPFHLFSPYICSAMCHIHVHMQCKHHLRSLHPRHRMPRHLMRFLSTISDLLSSTPYATKPFGLPISQQDRSIQLLLDCTGSRDKLQSMPFQLPGKKPPVAEQCFWLLGNVVGKTGIDMPGTLWEHAKCHNSQFIETPKKRLKLECIHKIS